MRKITLAAIVAAALQLGACATVTRGTSTAWEINTDPSGARVETSHGFFCEATPCAMKMPRKSEFTATVSKDGYKPATLKVSHKIGNGGGAGMAGNVLLGGIIGAGVDASSGAMLDLVPNPANVKLEKLEPAAPATVAAASPAPAPATATPAAVAVAPAQ